MDHMMPGMDGLTATQLIRGLPTEYSQTLPIIACTANAIVGNEEMFLRNGFQAFLSKPIELMRLDDIIKRWIRDKHPEYLEEVAVQDDDATVDPMQQLITATSIEGMDLERGIMRFGGNGTTYANVLRSYVQSTNLVLAKLDKVSESSIAEYAIDIHGLKSASQGVGAYLVGSLAEALEVAAKARDMSYVSSNMQEFIYTTKELLQAIEQLLQRFDQDQSKPHKAKPETTLIEELLEACQKYQMDRVDEIIQEIESFSYDSDAQLVAWLGERVQRMDFAEIAKRLEEWLGEQKPH
jgi:CheY-like chemotaxis protein